MKTLIAGFGNVLLGDDGFGVEVIKRMEREALVPEHAQTIEVGIGGFDLVLRLMDGFDRVVIVDAVCRRQPAGTLHVFKPGNLDGVLRPGENIDPHFTEPARALIMARQLGVLPPSVTIIGCEPLTCELGLGLSAPVAAAVPMAMETVRNHAI